MERWVISHDGTLFYPELVTAAVNQGNPTLKFVLGNKKFAVEFKNRTDYFASSYGTYADVQMISSDRSKRFAALAALVKIN